jgi:predicted Zn-dependent protease
MDKAQATEAIERALACGESDEMEVGIEGQRVGFTRFSNERITQNLSRSMAVMTLKASYGRCEGVVKTTDFTPEGIHAAVRLAEETARNAEENLEHVPPLDPCEVPVFESFFDKTEKVGPFDRARRIKDVLTRCASLGHTCAGLIGNGTMIRATGNSKGHGGFHRRSWARMHCTVMTEDSSGWKRVTSEDIDRIDPDAVFAAALEKAERSRKPIDLEPGRYTVVLESAAVVDMLAFFFWCYNAKLAHEGRSFMSGRIGEKIAHETVNLSTEPGHPQAPGFPFQPDGLPCPAAVWIRNGVAETLLHDRFWAAKLGGAAMGMPPPNLIMAGTDASLDDLVAGVDRGILVSRFWYVRFVDQMKLLLTGMTRDGTFLIEDGKIRGGIKNMRWNDSVLGVLNRIEAIGRAERQGEMVDALIPPLRVSDFRFTSKTLF